MKQLIRSHRAPKRSTTRRRRRVADRAVASELAIIVDARRSLAEPT